MSKSLHKVYEKRHLKTKLFLERMLYSMTYDETFNMKYYIKSVFEVVDSLSCLVKLIPEADIVEIFLCGIPESYDSLIRSLEALPSGGITIRKK